MMIIQDLFKENQKEKKKQSFVLQLLYSVKYKLWYVQMIVKGIEYTSPVSTEDSHHSNVSIRMPLPKHGSSLSHAYEYIIHISLGNFYFRHGCDAEITACTVIVAFFKNVYI